MNIKCVLERRNRLNYYSFVNIRQILFVRYTDEIGKSEYVCAKIRFFTGCSKKKKKTNTVSKRLLLYARIADIKYEKKNRKMIKSRTRKKLRYVLNVTTVFYQTGLFWILLRLIPPFFFFISLSELFKYLSFLTPRSSY